MKVRPTSRVTGRQLSTELPEDRAPDEVIVDADNRLRRAPAGTFTKVRIGVLWDRASQDIAISLTDQRKDVEFMRGFSLACEIYGLRLGSDPMMPRMIRPGRYELIPVAARQVIDCRGLLQDEIPTALQNIDLDRLSDDDQRLTYVTAARKELRILDGSLETVQAQIENRMAPAIELIYQRGRSIIDNHSVLNARLDRVREFTVGAAEQAADTRKERDRVFESGVEAARQAQAAQPAPAAATPPVATPPAAVAPPPAAAPKIKRTAGKRPKQ